ncbi:hypothetical protein Syun_005858 [Stephania yunnanensis]|uniref:carbamoyl-phosphate synthase (ammonia) n=1 Tax=Stephania yunnanensis TaxID=152371 RepID=A0AAP0PX09_9MAGN
MLAITGSLRRPRIRPLSIRSSSFSAAAAQAERTIRQGARNDWSRDEVKAVYDSPVLDLLFHGVSSSSQICSQLKLALPIQKYLDDQKLACASGARTVRIWGTSPDSIDAAEDRERFNAILKELEIEQSRGGIAKSEAAALTITAEIGYPVVVRPSYVLGGRAMEIVYSDEMLVKYLETAVEADPERPVLIDKYAIEIDVDALADLHGNVVIGGIMEHIEQAGVHSGLGRSLYELGFTKEVIPRHVYVKEAVLPFEKFQGCDVLLGPEMRSTGESGTVFLSLNDLTKPHLANIARAFCTLGFKIVATSGTAHVLELEKIPVERALKMHEGQPHAGDELDQSDGRQLRRMALAYKVPIITTVAGALATADAIKSMKHRNFDKN